MTRLAAPLALTLLVAACAQESPLEVPGPVAMTEEAVGHYCQMIVLEHPGPKAQVHIAGIAEPIWFSQVRDAFVFDRLPEETAEIAEEERDGTDFATPPTACRYVGWTPTR